MGKPIEVLIKGRLTDKTVAYLKNELRSVDLHASIEIRPDDTKKNEVTITVREDDAKTRESISFNLYLANIAMCLSNPQSKVDSYRIIYESNGKRYELPNGDIKKATLLEDQQPEHSHQSS